MKKFYSNLPGIIFGILVICFLIGFSVLAWTEPTQAPPQGNVPAPINVGNINQYKTGRIGAYTNGIDTNYGLTVGSGATPQGLKATGNSYFQNNLYIMGNVGIGTTNPQSTIGYGTNLIHQYGNAPAYILENTVGTAVRWEIGANTAGFLSIGTGSLTTGMVIKNNGNVGIGTTNPGTNRLEVVGGPIKATDGLIIETRTSDPATPATGQMWLRTDI